MLYFSPFNNVNKFDCSHKTLLIRYLLVIDVFLIHTARLSIMYEDMSLAHAIF